MAEEYLKNVQLFGCGKCLKYYNESDRAKNCFYKHTATSLKCELCAETFSESSHLTFHVHIHSNEQPFKSEVGDSLFAQNRDMKCRKRVHKQQS